MIVLRETSDEYLLSIPAKEKERARGIRGRRWDIERKVWRFDRTIEAHDALISEFAEDASVIEITRPDDFSGEAAEEASTLPPPPSDQEILRLEKRIAELEEALGSRDKSENYQQEKIRYLEAEVTRLKNEIASLIHPPPQIGPATVVDYVNLAVAASNANRELRAILERNITRDGEFDSLLVIDIANSLEQHLKKSIPALEATASLHELLVKAKEIELLGADDLDLAHIIRKQRNLVAHQPTKSGQKFMRFMICISAASILWPRLSLMREGGV